MTDPNTPQPEERPEPAENQEVSTSPAKAHPEAFAFRGTPERVIKFKRAFIVGLVTISSVAVMGVTWMALRPATFKLIADTQSKVSTDRKRPPEEFANAPGTYANPPKLGIPLPGDLGRPILRAQRQMATEAGGAPTADQAADRAAQAAEAERQRIAEEKRKVREASVMLPLSRTPSFAERAPEPLQPASPQTAETAPAPGISLDPERDPGAQSRKADFAARTPTDSDINPHRLQPSPSPYTLSAGSIIAASMVTGLNSDLPGFVTAQVTENAYDSATGRILLIPQGAKLIGQYDSVIAFGQNRALLVWNRIILPDGSSIRIDNAPATDVAGYAGLADKANVHSWRLLKGIALSTLLGVGTQLTFGTGESDLVRAIRESTQQNADRAGQQLVSKNFNIQPTITVRPGWPLRVVVHKDIVLRPWSEWGGE
jgi:type IV secretion system protein TrbI